MLALSLECAHFIINIKMDPKDNVMWHISCNMIGYIMRILNGNSPTN